MQTLLLGEHDPAVPGDRPPLTDARTDALPHLTPLDSLRPVLGGRPLRAPGGGQP
jgi:hypothetical protein